MPRLRVPSSYPCSARGRRPPRSRSCATAIIPSQQFATSLPDSPRLAAPRRVRPGARPGLTWC